MKQQVPTLRALFIILLFGTLCWASTGFAQNQILGGVSVGQVLKSQDSNFVIHTKNIHIPLLAYDFKYSSVAVPVIHRELTPASRIGFGLLGYASIHQNQPSRLLSATQKEMTTYEVSTTVFHLEYILLKPIISDFKGYLFIGPTIAESVLTEAVELYKLSDDGSGGIEETFSGVSKKYDIDYNLGLTLGSGINYEISDAHEIALTARYLYGKTNLSTIEGDKILSGSTQLQLIFMTRFD